MAAPLSNVVVLGMHRSGTSLIASLLADSGLHAGEPDELLTPQEDNPLGFWERSDVMSLNDRILAERGASWYRPHSSSDPASIRGYQEAARQVAGRLQAPWVIKDPRFALTWADWAPILEPVVFIHVYRNPVAVARSLQKRNGISLDYGLALWEIYNRRILTLTRGRRGGVISYDRFCSQPEQTVRELVRDLENAGVALPVSGPARFDPALNHSTETSELSDALLTPEQAALHEYCSLLAIGGPVPGDPPEEAAALQIRLDSFADQYDRQLLQAATAEENERQLADTQEQLDRSEAEREATRSDLEALSDHLRSMDSELAESRNTQIELNDALVAERTNSEYLFSELQTTDRKLLEYDDSLLGRAVSGVSIAYKYLSFRRGNTAMDDALESAEERQQRFGWERTPPRHSRFTSGWRVLKYAAAHPHSTFRNLSLARLGRLTRQFTDLGSEDLGRWVDQRFPAAETSQISVLESLDDDLDDLRLDLPCSGRPQVSIVVPVFNHYRMTVNCLRSVLEHTSDIEYEVIVGDDASTDLTTTIEERIQGIRVVRAEANQGFIRNCNSAAEHAVGDLVVFLNNDTAVTDGWLTELVGVMEEDEGVGVVGPKLLFGDGRLQEAGGIIWADASGWNFGRLEDPNAFEFNYRRNVDFVSGACLMIRKALWNQLSGFDERFVPAYYEDVDVCFAAREAGYEVVYQPAATVFHFEGVSNGTDTGSGIKKYQVDNQVKFREKWSEVLALEHFPNGSEVFVARDRSRGRNVVVVIDHYVPFFDKDAGSRSVYQYLRLLVSMGYNVKFIGANFFPHQPYTKNLQQLGIEVLVGEAAAAGIEKWLLENAARIQTLYLNRPHIAEQFLDTIDRMQPRPNVAFWGCDLHYLRKQREHGVTGDGKQESEAQDWKAREYRIFDQVDHIYYPSEAEVTEIHSHRPDLDAKVLPLYVMERVAVPAYDPRERSGLLFVGGFGHPPNLDGLMWFVKEILPEIQHSLPDVCLHIVGSNMPEEVKTLSSEQIQVHGFVTDAVLESLYQQIRVAVIPLRFGAGIKGKVVEALQHGVPTVTTSIGAEGLPEAESVLCVADDEQVFAQKVISAVQGEAEPIARLANYQGYLDANFSRERAEQIILRDFGPPSRRS